MRKGEDAVWRAGVEGGGGTIVQIGNLTARRLRVTASNRIHLERRAASSGPAVLGTGRIPAHSTALARVLPSAPKKPLNQSTCTPKPSKQSHSQTNTHLSSECALHAELRSLTQRMCSKQHKSRLAHVQQTTQDGNQQTVSLFLMSLLFTLTFARPTFSRASFPNRLPYRAGGKGRTQAGQG